MKYRDRRMKHIYEYVDQKGRQASERLDEARLILQENPRGPARETVIELDAAARRIAACTPGGPLSGLIFAEKSSGVLPCSS